ncbi:hypothetical protein D3C75_1260600 [compost metagenome]
MRIRGLQLHDQPRHPLCQRVMQIPGHPLPLIGQGKLLHLLVGLLKLMQKALDPQPLLNLAEE